MFRNPLLHIALRLEQLLERSRRLTKETMAAVGRLLAAGVRVFVGPDFAGAWRRPEADDLS